MKRVLTTIATALVLIGFGSSPALAEEDNSKIVSKDYVLGTIHISPLLVPVGDRCADDPQVGGVYFCWDDTSGWGLATVTILDASGLQTGAILNWQSGGSAAGSILICGSATVGIPAGADALNVNAGGNFICGPFSPGTTGTVTVELS